MKNYWQRFSLFENGLNIFFIINLFMDIINKKVLSSTIPIEILAYLFWLSLGLLLGFRLCKHEYNRTLRKQVEQK
jgi:hypothetical protein